MSSYKLFAQRVGLVGVTNLLLGLSGIILLPILTKNLPIQDYGIWAQIMVTIGIVPAISMLGLPYAMVRHLPSLKKKEEIQDAFYSIFFLVLFTVTFVSATIYIFSETLASSLFNNNTVIVKTLALIVFIESLNHLLINYFRAMQQIKKYSTLLLTKTSVQIVFVSFFVLSGKGIIGATFGLLITTLILFLIMTFIIFLDIGFIIPKFKNIKKYLNFGVPTVPGNLSSWIVNSSDRYVIGILMGPALVGYYSPGYSLGSIIQMFLAPFNFILPPYLAQHYDKNEMEIVAKTLEYSLKYFLAIAIPSVFGLSILSKLILEILTTPIIASQGYLVIPLVAVSTLLFGVFGFFQHIIILEKKTTIMGKIWMMSSLLNLGLNFLLIPYLGIIGAAIATLISFSFNLIIALHYSLQILKFNINLKFIIKSVLASIIMSLLIIKLNPTELFEILVSILSAAVTYVLALVLLKSFDSFEISLFRNKFKI